MIFSTPLLYAGAAVGVALTVALGVQTVRLASVNSDISRISAQADKDKAAAEREGREALEAYRIEAEEIAEKQAEVLNEGIEQYRAMAENERAARVASERLRDATKRACRGAAQQGAPAVAAGPAASSPADLYADVSRRLDEAADGIAVHADDTFIRSTACEGSYEALRPKP